MKPLPASGMSDVITIGRRINHNLAKQQGYGLSHTLACSIVVAAYPPKLLVDNSPQPGAYS